MFSPPLRTPRKLAPYRHTTLAASVSALIRQCHNQDGKSPGNNCISMTDFEEEVAPLRQKRALSFLFRRVLPLPSKTDRKEYPHKTANLFSRAFFWWTIPIMGVGYTRTLITNDLYKISDDLDAERNTLLMEKELARYNEKDLDWRKLAYATTRAFKWEIFLVIVFSTTCLLLDSGIALVTKKFIEAAEERAAGDSSATRRGMGLAFAVTAVNFAVELSVSHFYYASAVVGTKVKAVFTQIMLKKSFRLGPEGRNKFPSAKIMSICTTDLARVELAMMLTPLLVAAPLPFALSIGILAMNVGIVTLVALGLVAFAAVYFTVSVKQMFKTRGKVVEYTDARVAIMKEIISNLKIIKYYCWEVPYLRLLMDSRFTEVQVLLKLQNYRNTLNAIYFTYPTLVSMICFIVLYAIKGEGQSAARIYSSVQAFAALGSLISVVPQSLSSLGDLINGYKRVAQLLSQDEVVDLDRYIRASNGDIAVEVSKASFLWEQFENDEENEDETKKRKDSGEPQKQGEQKPQEGSSNPATDDIEMTQFDKSKLSRLNDISLSIRKGEFIIVTGYIGSGKSSLLNALAGFMTCDGGSVTVDGSLILCADPWIANTTIRDNITFGLPYEHDWYDQVIYACSLQSDLSNMAGGDLTEVGEKGITLSGGQKLRISLARAVYANKDIVIMDDVLSAVDARVSKHIVKHCCMGLLAKKTRVLATHQLSLIEGADRIVFMNGDGTVDVGTPEELARNAKFQRLLSFSQQTKDEEETEKDESEVSFDDVKTQILEDIGASGFKNMESSGDQTLKRRAVVKVSMEDEEEEFRDIHVNIDAEKGKIITVEEKAVNSLKAGIYKEYLKFGTQKTSIVGYLALLFVLTVLAVLGELFSSIWLTYWVSDSLHRLFGFYAGLYVVIFLGFLVFLYLEFSAVAVMCNYASRNLNLAAARRILKTPMSYLDVTPMGRILNRFTKDTDALDNEISQNIKMLLKFFSHILGSIILNIVYVPWIGVLIPFFAVMYFCVANYYQASSREIKRLEAVQRSFMIGSLTETLFGQKTIKSYGEVSRYIQKTGELMNCTNEATFLQNAASRWLLIALQIIASSFGLIVFMLSVSGSLRLKPATIGLLVTNITLIASELSGMTALLTQVENDMNSAERLIHYATSLPQEEDEHSKGFEPEKKLWPKSGTMSFKNVTMLYRSGLPPVLKDLTFDVQSGQKIGVCGRTGAGKSSLMTAIFRLCELDGGSITYDNMDISRLSLHALRSNLAIIPQESVLFNGTIRKNLDPFEEHTDAELWDVLVRSRILTEAEAVEEAKKAGQSLTKSGNSSDQLHKFHLYQVVTDEGGNYSVGERQLISFARALIKDVRVLILDEATSSVDYETDHKIQTTIKKEFLECTILTIAHRLRTILNYDKILTLDSGELRQFDTPYNLFKSPGIFRDMCERSNISENDFQLSITSGETF